jgi:hypothetical protein
MDQTMVLQIPKGFNLNDEESLRQLIRDVKALPASTPLGIDTAGNNDQGKHHLPSPGMAAAHLPSRVVSPRSAGTPGSKSGSPMLTPSGQYDKTIHPAHSYDFAHDNDSVTANSTSRPRVIPESVNRSRSSSRNRYQTAPATAVQRSSTSYTVPTRYSEVPRGSLQQQRYKINTSSSFGGYPTRDEIKLEKMRTASRVFDLITQSGNVLQTSHSIPPDEYHAHSVSSTYRSQQQQQQQQADSMKSTHDSRDALSTIHQPHSEMTSHARESPSVFRRGLSPAPDVAHRRGLSNLDYEYLHSAPIEPGQVSSKRVVSHYPQRPPPTYMDGPIASDDFHSIASASSACSVTSEAIDALLARIEETKAQLERPAVTRDEIERQARLANLLDNLAVAADEIQKYENQEM